jgi:hypothetical protein
MITSIIGYVLVGYLVSCFVNMMLGVAMNHREHEKEGVEKI